MDLSELICVHLWFHFFNFILPGCLSTMFASLDAGVPLTSDKTHGSGRLDKLSLVDIMSRFFFEYHVPDKFNNFCPRGAAPENIPQVMFGGREKAGADLSVSRQTNP